MFPVHFAARSLHSSLLGQKVHLEHVLVMPFARGDKQFFLTLNRS